MAPCGWWGGGGGGGGGGGCLDKAVCYSALDLFGVAATSRHTLYRVENALPVLRFGEY